MLQPIGIWDVPTNYEVTKLGKCDSEYTKDATRLSVNGWSVFLYEVPISAWSKMMPVVVLSVSEAECDICFQSYQFQI